MTILGHVDYEFHIVIYFLKQFQCGYINLHFLQQWTHTYLLTPSLTLIKQFIFFFLSNEGNTSISLPGIWHNFYLNDGIIILHKAHSIKQSSTVSDVNMVLLRSLPGESHGRRSLVGYSPWGHKESDMTERLHSLTHTLNPTLVLWSCTENTGDILFMSKFTLFDIIFQDLCPDFNPYFCLIQNAWDNCFIFPINMVSNEYFSTQY